MTRHLIPGLCLVLGACAADAVRRDGFLLEREKTDELLGALTRRASFDFHCPAEGLILTVLAVHDDAGPDMPKQVGVVGCGQRATYSMEFLPVGGGQGMWMGGGRAGIWTGYGGQVETGWKLEGGIVAAAPNQ